MFTKKSALLVLVTMGLSNMAFSHTAKECIGELNNIYNFPESNIKKLSPEISDNFLKKIKNNETKILKIETIEAAEKTAGRSTSTEYLVSDKGQKVFARVFYWFSPIAKGQHILTFEKRDFKTGKLISSEDVEFKATAVTKKISVGALQPVILGNRKFVLLRDVNTERLEYINKNHELSETADNNYLMMEVPEYHSIQPRVISLHLHIGLGVKIENVQFSPLTPNGQFTITYSLYELGKSTIYSRRGTLGNGMPTLGFSETHSQSLMNISGNLTPVMIADTGVPTFDPSLGKVTDYKARTVYINDSGKAIIQDVVTKFGRTQIEFVNAIDLQTENLVMDNFKILKGNATGTLLGLVTSHDRQNRTVYTQFDISDRDAQIKAHTSYEPSVETNLLNSHFVLEETNMLSKPSSVDPMERLSR